MKQTSDRIIKNIDWNLCIICQRNDPNLSKLRGSGKERDTLVRNLEKIWNKDKEKSSSIAINIHLFDLMMDQRISKPHFNITMRCSATGATVNTVNRRLIG